MLAEDALILVNVVLLAAALPLTVVAYRGFRDTPWGRALQPVSVIAAGYMVARMIELLPLEGDSSSSPSSSRCSSWPGRPRSTRHAWRSC